MILDAHATIGDNRSVSLGADELVALMDALGIDAALVSSADRHVALLNAEGNNLVTAAADRHPGRLLPYAVATPWAGDAALAELRRAHDLGARALKLDPGLQGFDLLDGLADPLVALAADLGWPVYVRTGTPPYGLPLAVAELARRFPDVTFVLGKAGATDFALDGPPALERAPNLISDTAYVMWPVASAERFPGRIVFASDAPFSDAGIEIWRVRDAVADPDTLAAVLGASLAKVLDGGR